MQWCEKNCCCDARLKLVRSKCEQCVEAVSCNVLQPSLLQLPKSDERKRTACIFWFLSKHACNAPYWTDTAWSRYGIMLSLQKKSHNTNNLKAHNKKFVNNQPWLSIHWSVCSLNLTRFGAAVLTKIDETKIFFWFFTTAFHENKRYSAIPKSTLTQL